MYLGETLLIPVRPTDDNGEPGDGESLLGEVGVAS